MSVSCYDWTVLITCWRFEITKTNENSVRRSRAFVLILQFTFHSRSKWEAPDDIAPIFSDSGIKKTADVRIATDRWIAVFYYFLIKLYCLPTSGLAVFIIKWKFLRTASRFKTTERSNEMRITPGGKKVKIEQINCVMGTDKRRFPMIYSSVKPSEPSQNWKNVTLGLTLFKYVNSFKESLLAFIIDI